MALHALCARLHTARLAATLVLILFATGCASLAQRDPVRINVVGIAPLPGQGMEMRLAVKLRVQNPNDDAIEFDGVALELEVNDKLFAAGVSASKGSVPRFGEVVLEVPVSVSAMAVVRQALGMIEGKPASTVPYVLRGRLGGGLLGGRRFSSSGTLELPAPTKDTPPGGT